MYEKFKNLLLYSIENQTYVRLTLSKAVRKTSALKNVYIRLVLLDQPTLSFTYRYRNKDQVHNYPLDKGWAELESMIGVDFKSATLMTTEQDLILTLSKKGKVMYTKVKPSFKDVPSYTHDREKVNRIGIDKPYLKHLGIVDDQGRVIHKMADKYRQINKYLEIIEHQLKDAKMPHSFHVVDMGSGKGYLTFALYQYLIEKGYKASVTGVELRTELVEYCNNVAQKCGYDNLKFEAQYIQNYKGPKIDMLIALHACNTATDDAIAKGVLGESALIILAPCCHKQIRQQIESNKTEDPILKYGIFRERQFEMVTDAIRALILESKGYDTKIFEFISSEHTSKNIMIVGVRSKVDPDAQSKIDLLKTQYGIEEHYLETLI